MSQNTTPLFKNRTALIAGAGPTGLTLACELVRRGIDIRLIEPLEKRTEQSRALAIQPRTLEIFDKMGIINPFLKSGLKIKQLNVYRKGKKAFEVNFSAMQTPYPFILSIPQAETERILTEHLQSLGKKIERGTQVTSIKNGYATLSQKNGDEELLAPTWTIGCDGAHSKVRHSLNAAFKGSQFTEIFVLADFEIDGPYAHDEGHLFFSDQGIFALLPLPKKGHFRVVTAFPSDSAIHQETLNLPFFEKLAMQRTGRDDLHIKSSTWISLFHVHRRIVARMRYENIFLAGDAAHIHSPAGGQGLNMSVQDAYNLAWKLALVDSGKAKDMLLNTYQQERHPVAERVLFSTTLATKLLATARPWVKDSGICLLQLLLKSSLRKRFLDAISGISIRYRKSSNLKQPLFDTFWSAPKIGERAPDAPLLNESLFDALRLKEYVLLTFSPLPKPLEEQLLALGVSCLRVDGGKITEIYSATPSSLFLIRPDGYIGYRSRTLRPQHLLTYLHSFLI